MAKMVAQVQGEEAAKRRTRMIESSWFESIWTRVRPRRRWGNWSWHKGRRQGLRGGKGWKWWGGSSWRRWGRARRRRRQHTWRWGHQWCRRPWSLGCDHRRTDKLTRSKSGTRVMTIRALWGWRWFGKPLLKGLGINVLLFFPAFLAFCSLCFWIDSTYKLWGRMITDRFLFSPF